jgi:polyhydroxyalkanoate synthase
LPLHLVGVIQTWMGSRSALPLLRSGLFPWRPDCAAAGRRLEEDLGAVDPEAFTTAVEAELASRADAFLTGVEAYRVHPYRRRIIEPAPIWAEGTTRLLDYGRPGEEGAPVLVVPSLINRGYVLDLERRHSFLRYLAQQGLRPLLVDWGAPGNIEAGFSLTDYVAGRLDGAFEAAIERFGAPIGVLGYCMGGLLALALTLRRRRETGALVLLATPWDFHAERIEQARLMAAVAGPLVLACTPLGAVPVDVLQTLFFALDPQQGLRKFSEFGALDPASERARRFVALEDWVNDGVPLPVRVAEECLAGWYGANAPAVGTWRVAGTCVDPGHCTVPALVVLPARDRIVPPASAAALAQALPGARTLQVASGHIGMVVGERAPDHMWSPVAEWLSAALHS